MDVVSQSKPHHEFSKKQGGRRVDEWKYKLAKYGTRFAEAYSGAFKQDSIDDY